MDREKRKREGVKEQTEAQRKLDEIERVQFIEAKKREKAKAKADRDAMQVHTQSHDKNDTQGFF